MAALKAPATGWRYVSSIATFHRAADVPAGSARLRRWRSRAPAAASMRATSKSLTAAAWGLGAAAFAAHPLQRQLDRLGFAGLVRVLVPKPYCLLVGASKRA
jgi:hypothetical protein